MTIMQLGSARRCGQGLHFARAEARLQQTADKSSTVDIGAELKLLNIFPNGQ